MDYFTFSDMSRSARAALWVGFHVLCWLSMGLSCRVNLPPNCRRASEPMEVLTELPVLLAFALSQASVRKRCPKVVRCAEPLASKTSKQIQIVIDIRRLVGVIPPHIVKFFVPKNGKAVLPCTRHTATTAVDIKSTNVMSKNTSMCQRYRVIMRRGEAEPEPA